MTHIFGLISLYAAWILIIKLLALTFITYFIASPQIHFQDISDSFASNEINLMGISALLFVLFFHWINPLSKTKIQEIFHLKNIEKKFIPGFFKGSLLASALIFLFITIGYYKYIGYYLQLYETPLEILNVFFRVLTLIFLVYSEEFIFRCKIKDDFPKKCPFWLKAHCTALLYCLIKILQFDLGISQLATFYFLSLLLSYKTEKSGSFVQGAGYWSAILVVFHPILSLPICGNSFSGILLIKSIPFPAIQNEFFSKDTWTRWMTGGAGGPLSSLSFQMVVVVDFMRNMVSIEKVIKKITGK